MTDFGIYRSRVALAPDPQGANRAALAGVGRPSPLCGRLSHCLKPQPVGWRYLMFRTSSTSSVLRLAFLLFLFWMPLACHAEDSGDNADLRPAFDKSDRQGKVFAHVNEWKDTTDAQRAIDLDRVLLSSFGDETRNYAYAAHLMERYGIDGFYIQSLLGLRARMREVLEGFRLAGNGRTAALFLSGRARTIRSEAEKARDPVNGLAEGWIEFFQKYEAILEHPNYDRADGRPVIYLYSEPAEDPRTWAAALERIEAETGPKVWILHDFRWTAEKVRRWLPAMDGIGQYTANGVWRDMPMVAEILNSPQWSHKIFEPGILPKHQSVAQGQTLGDMGFGTWVLRRSTEMMFGLDPDSLQVTNWNDIEENSHVVPSYLQWDGYLRILRELTADFRGAAPVEREKPDLIVTQKIDRMVGEVIQLEVLSLPARGAEDGAGFSVRAEWVDASGEVVKRFPEWQPSADDLAVRRYALDSGQVADKLAVYPKITYEWRGQVHGPYRLRPTRLWYGAQPTDMTWITPLDRWRPEFAEPFWAGRPGQRPVDWHPYQHRLRERGGMAFPGDVATMPTAGPETFRAFRGLSDTELKRDTETELLRNGSPFASFGTADRVWARATDTLFKRPHDAPLAWLEAETMEFRTREMRLGDGKTSWRQPSGVWVSRAIYAVPDASWRETVTVPVPYFSFGEETVRRIKEDHVGRALRNQPLLGVKEHEVPRFRVPFWHYRFQEDRGGLAMDHSGYDRHGWLGLDRVGRLFGGLHLHDGPFGFRFGNYFGTATRPIRSADQLGDDAPEFRDPPGDRPHLRFDGEDDVVFFPQRTGFPYAETIELVLRPGNSDSGREQTVFSYALNWGGSRDDGRAVTNKVTIGLDEKGRLLVRAEDDGSDAIPVLRSSAPLPESAWSHVAVVYDGREVRAYINGKPLEGALTLLPHRGLRHHTSVLLGGRMNAYRVQELTRKDEPVIRFFAGDVAELRITGRPLAPDAFLRSPEPPR